MENLTERLEVRVGTSTMRRLRDTAARRGVSVGQMVRQALSRELGEEHDDRLQAAEALFAVGAPVADWPEMEREIEAAREPCVG